MSLLSLLHRIRFVSSYCRHPRFISRLFSSFAHRLVECHPGQSFFVRPLVPFHLPRVFSAPQIVALQQPVPRLEPVCLLDRRNIRIDPRPDFGWGCAL